MKSKTIILSNENQKGRGIITLMQEEDYLGIRLRLYNIEKLNEFCKVGIYHEGKAYSSNLLEKNGSYTSSIVGDFDIDKDFYSAVIDTSKDNLVIVSGGTYAGCFFNDNSVFLQDNPNANYVDVDINENHVQKGNINNEIPPCDIQSNSCADCEHCMYKEYFYSSQNIKAEMTEKENKIESVKENEAQTILGALIPQFNYVFENYPIDDRLSALLPDGKFVEICEGAESYSIGALYEGNEMKYICYARFANYLDDPPSELGEHYQWLPFDKDDPLSSGYYIVFQDVKDLKIVKF